VSYFISKIEKGRYLHHPDDEFYILKKIAPVW